MSIDPEDFISPRYEIWSRSTVNDGRGDSRFSGPGGDIGEPLSLRRTTPDVQEARKLSLAEQRKPSTVVEVRVTWVRDEKAYRTAVELDQLAALKQKYPNA